MNHRLASALAAFAFVACTGDAPGFAALTAAANMAEGTGSSTAADTSSLTRPTDETDGPVDSSSTSIDAGTADTTSTAAATTEADVELVQPRILAVDMPAMVHVAGPVAVEVTAENATAVRGTLDGAQLEIFKDQGGGVWLGSVPIFGAVDNGDHVLEVTATHGPLADTAPPVAFKVSTPAPGGQAWALLGPSGSTTRRAAITAEGDMIEVGALEVGGVLKPSLRKRSGANGSELWPEGTIVLDEREGSADAVAVRADGRIWVAMNVKNPNKKWQPRIVLFDVDGHVTDVEAPTEPGPTVRGIAATDDGGFFAVGFGGSTFGDMDVVYWRMTGENAATASAKPWDYVPPDDLFMKHKFDDLAFDVVIVDGMAWVVGGSTGDHGLNNDLVSRGIVVRLDVETGAALEPAIVAEPVNAWRNSTFYAAGRHPDGVVVTGNETTADLTIQQITVQAFNAGGGRTYYKSEWAASVAYGTGVAWSAHDVALVAGVVRDGDVLRGILYGRGAPGLNFDHLFPGIEPSAANALALDAYDQPYVVGERTVGGERQARAARIHQ